MNFAAFVKTAAARWVGIVLAVVVLLVVARCSGINSGKADARIGMQDSVTKATEAQTKAFDAVRAADNKKFLDSLEAEKRARIAADSQAARANRALGRISIVGPVRPPAPAKGDTAAPDTAKYVAVQREGDPKLYTIPQFVVDAGAELRKALTSSRVATAKAENALTAAKVVIAADSDGIRSRDGSIQNLKSEVSTLKSDAGRECRVLPFVPCPPRKVVAVVTFAATAIGTYVLARK